MKLKILIHSFYFDNGIYVKWHPKTDSGKAKDWFNVTIEFPPTERGSDTISFQKKGPPSASASRHLLKWAIKDRKKALLITAQLG